MVSLGLDSVLHIEDPRSVLTKNQPVGNLLALTTYCQCTNFMEMESDHLDEMAAMNLGQDLHDSSTEQHGELSTCMSHVEDAGSLPHPSPYATSSLSAQPSGSCQESNDVEMAASPPSISDSTTSISQDLSLRQSSVLRYSDVKEVGAKAEIPDFDIVVTTHEGSADPEVHTDPQAGSAGATLIGSFRSLVGDASAADMQQVKWLKWAETQCGDKRTGRLWTKDTMLRNLKRQIQSKLQGRYFLAN